MIRPLKLWRSIRQSFWKLQDNIYEAWLRYPAAVTAYVRKTKIRWHNTKIGLKKRLSPFVLRAKLELLVIPRPHAKGGKLFFVTLQEGAQIARDWLENTEYGKTAGLLYADSSRLARVHTLDGNPVFGTWDAADVANNYFGDKLEAEQRYFAHFIAIHCFLYGKKAGSQRWNYFFGEGFLHAVNEKNAMETTGDVFTKIVWVDVHIRRRTLKRFIKRALAGKLPGYQWPLHSSRDAIF